MSLWMLGQIGIAIEICGGIIGFISALRTWSKWKNLPSMIHYPMDKALEGPKEEFVGQFQGHAWAFFLLAVGLILQFAGNLANQPGG